MGNAASCAPSIISSGVVKVLLPEGNMQIHTKPVKAADLMLENPGNFVCASSSLIVGYRIHGLNADEVLERRQLYFLLPMELLYSVLTPEEMSSLTCKATKAFKHATFNNLVKIFPEFCISPFEPETPENQVNKTADSVERYSKQRSWKPALETILETACYNLLVVGYKLETGDTSFLHNRI
ncbi:uncharacterized protein LOC111274714 [Durio zibethinus]|uniref:Uncharacterized protein LOC111274714 n=1 Tax=Durio zibethinus TaxID=66656 RepID=A0A6P5WHA5_DURZI|nr:uncharacterized protein LOC111274714 [Durio zibethinus]